jgi:hypothetical protein
MDSRGVTLTPGTTLRFGSLGFVVTTLSPIIIPLHISTANYNIAHKMLHTNYNHIIATNYTSAIQRNATRREWQSHTFFSQIKCGIGLALPLAVLRRPLDRRHTLLPRAVLLGLQRVVLPGSLATGSHQTVWRSRDRRCAARCPHDWRRKALPTSGLLPRRFARKRRGEQY